MQYTNRQDIQRMSVKIVQYAQRQTKKGAEGTFYKGNRVECQYMSTLENFYGNLIKKEDLRQSISGLRQVLRESGELKESGALSGEHAMDRLYGMLEKDGGIDLLLDVLSEEDPKTRKNAALLIGELSEAMTEADRKVCIQKLYDCYGSELTRFVLSSYLIGLEHLTRSAELPEEMRMMLSSRLESIDAMGEIPVQERKHILSERKALSKLLHMEDTKTTVTFRMPGDNFDVLLTTDPADRELLFAQVKKETEAARSLPFGVLVSGRARDRVQSIGLYEYMMYRITPDKAMPFRSGQLKDALDRSDFGRFIDDCFGVDAKLAFRIFLHAPYEDRKRAAVIKKLEGEIEFYGSGRLQARKSDVDLHLHFYLQKNGNMGLLLRPLAQKDLRFAYRSRELDTSMAPRKAVKIVTLLASELSVGARVIDPFAGTGTLLIEREKAKPTEEMYALDTFGEAVTIGREAALAAGVRILYVHRDAASFTDDKPFTEIISELPDLFHKEADEKGQFFRELGEVTERLLSSGGVAFFLTSEGNALKSMIRQRSSLTFDREIPFDKTRTIYILHKK